MPHGIEVLQIVQGKGWWIAVRPAVHGMHTRILPVIFLQVGLLRFGQTGERPGKAVNPLVGREFSSRHARVPFAVVTVLLPSMASFVVEAVWRRSREYRVSSAAVWKRLHIVGCSLGPSSTRCRSCGSGLSSEEARAIGRDQGLAVAACGPAGGVLRLGPGAGVVLGEQALEHLAADGRADGVSDAVVLGESLDLVKVMLQIVVRPAVGIANRDVERDVQPTQFEQGLEARGGGMRVLLRDLGDHLRRQVAGVEEIVDLGQAEPEGLHQLLAMRVVALAGPREAGVSGLPEPCGEGEGIETIGW